MCAIGRGLMAAPSLLMIDELSLGLAPRAVELLIERLRDINRSGVAILLVEQDVMTALELADRGYVINRGQVSMSGASANAARRPDDPRSLYGPVISHYRHCACWRLKEWERSISSRAAIVSSRGRSSIRPVSRPCRASGWCASCFTIRCRSMRALRGSRRSSRLPAGH